ncbi:MAG: polysaccharide biosynthesis protein [Candidatus Omnitrophica bacterium]|nr:polysaccharide biosynthesis protein [Candidatus Omnitrophota bacterium]
MSYKATLKQRLFTNTLTNYVMRFWGWITGFFLFPFIVGRLGPQAAGVWLLAGSFAAHFAFLDLGMGGSLIKHIAQYRAQRNERKINQAITVALVIASAMGLVAATGMFILGRFFITCFTIPPALLKEARLITYLIGITLLFGFPAKTFASVLRGLQRYDLTNLIGFLVSLPTIILTIVFLVMGRGIVTLVLIESLTAVCGWLLTLYYTKKLFPALRVQISLFDKGMVKVLMGLALSLLIINICMIVIYSTDRLIIGAFLPIGLIVFYEAAYKIYHFVVLAPQVLASAIIPATSELNATNDTGSIRKLFLSGTKYTTAFFLALAVPVLILARYILTYWMGPGFGGHYLLVVIFISHLFFSFNHIFAYYLLVGMNQIRDALWYYTGSAALNLALSIFLVKRIGLMGVVLGTAIPYAVLEPFFVRQILRKFDVPLTRYLKNVIARTYPQAIIPAVGLYVLCRYWSPNNLMEAGACVGVYVLAYAAVFYVTGIEEWERKNVVGMALSTLARLKPRPDGALNTVTNNREIRGYVSDDYNAVEKQRSGGRNIIV